MSNLSKAYFIPRAGSGSSAGGVSGLRLTNPSTTTVGVAAGSAPDIVGGALINLPTAVVIDMAVVGALGIDTGAIAAASQYHVWLLKNPTTKAVTALASLAVTLAGVTKPAGFTIGRRIGSFHTLNAAATILPFTQEGSGNDRRYSFTLADAARAITALTSGVGLTEVPLGNSTVVANVSCSCIPTTATSVKLNVAVLCTNVSASAIAIQIGLNTPNIGAATIPVTAADATAAITKVAEFEVPVTVLTTATPAVGVTVTLTDTDMVPDFIVNGYTESLAA